MIALLFWAAVAAIAYTYAAFPAIVLLRGLVRPRPYETADIEPTVSIVIAAHNEEAVIAAKIENLLALDYPRQALEIVIASDGSDDATTAIVGRYADRGIKLLALPRLGKAEALNAAVGSTTGEILVFSDSNSMFNPGAIRALVRPFADPGVGGVAGDQRYVTSEHDTAVGERSYWSLDRMLKVAQSRAGSATSATGAIYAVRRELFRAVPEGVTDDFAVSTAVVAAGRRLVFSPDAVAHEVVAEPGGAEFARKVRIMTRGLRGVAVRRELLDGRRHGFYSLQLFSHKVLRRLMAAPLAVTLLTAIALRRRRRIYGVAAALQSSWYVAGLLGLLFDRRRIGRHPAFAIPAYFLLVNAASVRALWNLATGNTIRHWEPARATGERGEAPGAAPVPALGLEGDGHRRLTDVVRSLRGAPELQPDLSVVVPVNAREDLTTVLSLVEDLSRHRGVHRVELVFVINNYPPEAPPDAIDRYRAAGITVVAAPSVFRTGQAICFSARLPGVRAAAAEAVVTFDADCRIPDPNAVLDWYVGQFHAGASAAYTEVRYYDLRDRTSVKARMLAHYASRWAKRSLLGIPTTRGSNYGVRPSFFLPLCDQELMADDLNVGPTVKAAGGRVAYSRAGSLVVRTSGRRFQGGWLKLARYLRYRFRYNRMALPVGTNADRRSRGLSHDRPHRPTYDESDVPATR